MSDFYILDGRDVVGVANVTEWGRWFEKADRHVAVDIIDGVRVSTVFLGLDHRHWGKGPPIVFETMIFGGPLDGTQYRYSSWDDAAAGHAAQVKRMKAATSSAGAYPAPQGSPSKE